MAEVPNTGSNMSQVQHDDASPLVDPRVLREKRVLIVQELDIETVLAGLKPFLVNHSYVVNAINAESDNGKKGCLLIDFLQRFSIKTFGKFNTFLKIVAGTQPDLFCTLVGRAPTEAETDFCIQDFAQSLKEVIQGQSHSIVDSPLDEKIDLNSEHVQLAIVRDKPESETFDDLPHRYQAHLSKVKDKEDNIPAVNILDVDGNEEKPERVLLNGLAGTGKSTTCQWLGREWSLNRWGTQFKVLFMLQMRMLLVSDRQMTAVELLTLAGLYQVAGAGLAMPLISWLQSRVGKALIFIDGLDEVAGFTTRLRNCPVISDLNQKAHPLDLCLNILRGNLLPGITVITASRPFAGLDALQFDKKFEILGLTESRVKEFVERKHPTKVADIMAVLANRPLLMSVCSITFYCALISRLLAAGVVFPGEELQTYSRLMAFLIVQCVERKLPEWSFLIQVGTYFRKLAHMAYIGVFERQLKGEMSKLVFDDRDISQAELTPQDLRSIQEAGSLHFQKIKVGLRSSVTTEFFHLSVQEMLACAHLLPQLPLLGNILKQLFSGGQFNMALLYLFGLQYDTGSEWINDIRHSVNPSGEAPSAAAEQQLDDLIQGLCKQSDCNSKLQVCQLLHEGQMEDKAKSVVRRIVPAGKLTIADTLLTLIDLMAVNFVYKYADAITEIHLTSCGLTDTLLRFMTFCLLKDNVEKVLVLNLARNNLGVGGAETVSEWLKQNHTLHTLHLLGNEIGADGAVVLAAALQANTSLQVLNIHRNNIGSKGATAVAAALQTNSNLHTLYISLNSIGVTGATDIASALWTNTSLKSLDVAGNAIGDAGAAALAAALQTNTSLHTLRVNINHIGDAGAASFAAALQNNTVLQELGVSRNQISGAGIKALQAMKHQGLKIHSSNQGIV